MSIFDDLARAHFEVKMPQYIDGPEYEWDAKEQRYVAPDTQLLWLAFKLGYDYAS